MAEGDGPQYLGPYGIKDLVLDSCDPAGDDAGVGKC